MREDLNARAPRRIAVLDPVQARHRQLPGRRGEECLAPNHPQQPELGKRALPLRASCGSSATTSPEHAAEGLFPPGARAPRCACATATSSAAPAPTRMPRATSRRALHLRPATRAAARRAPTRARSRATSTGCPPRTRCPRRCGSTIGCSACRFRARAIRGETRGDGAAAVPAPRAPPRSPATTTTPPRPPSATTSTTSTRIRKRVIAAFVEPALAQAAPEDALPVRAARLLRRRPRRPPPGQAGVQPHRHAPRLLGASVARTSAARPARCGRRFRDPRAGDRLATARLARALRCASAPTLPEIDAMKRIVLFLVTNIAVMLVLSIVLQRARARPALTAQRASTSAAAGVLGRRRLHRLDHLAADVEADGQVVDRRARHRAAGNEPRPGWSRPCAGSPTRPASACPKWRSTRASPMRSPPARSGTPRWSPSPPACCSR